MQLWKQLRLRPSTTVTPCYGSGEFGRIVIGLTYESEQIATDGSRRLLHRLGQGVPFTDVKPPADSPTVELQKVTLTISLYRDECHINKANSGLDLNMRPGCRQDISQSTLDFDMDWDELIHHSEAEAGEEDLLLDNNGSEAPFGVPRRCFTGSRPCMQPADDSLAVAEEGTFQHLASGHLLDDVAGLIDAAVRLSVSSNHGKVGAGIKVTEMESFRQLADVAPSLFCPAYLSVRMAIFEIRNLL